jgi:hypothetical protein
MLFLPTPCPDYNGLTMQVVEYQPDDSYQARCVVCGFRSLGKISPELLIVKGDVAISELLPDTRQSRSQPIVRELLTLVVR